jgi:hypothetical protein
MADIVVSTTIEKRLGDSVELFFGCQEVRLDGTIVPLVINNYRWSCDWLVGTEWTNVAAEIRPATAAEIASLVFDGVKADHSFLYMLLPTNRSAGSAQMAPRPDLRISALLKSDERKLFTPILIPLAQS